MQAEVKHILPNYKAEDAIRFLQCACLPDPEAEDSIVSSIYFDTPELNSLAEKVNSDFLKSKFRIRWYRSLQTGALSSTAYFEVKGKTGCLRNKSRIESRLKPDFLDSCSLSDVQLMEETENLQQNGLRPGRPLVPVVDISYTRRRFVDPLSGSRICIDTDIVARRVNPNLFTADVPGFVQNAVIEIKGRVEELPGCYTPLFRLGMRKCSFSKYLAGYARARHVVYDPR